MKLFRSVCTCAPVYMCVFCAIAKILELLILVHWNILPDRCVKSMSQVVPMSENQSEELRVHFLGNHIYFLANAPCDCVLKFNKH